MLRLILFSLMTFTFLSFYPSQLVFAASGVGRIVYSSGPTWVERGSGREEIKKGAVVLQNDSIITGARGRVKVMMSDGSKIYIGTNSRVSLRKYAMNNNKLADATINMLWGKARFFVNKLASKKSSFRVRTSTAVLGVRGTDFLVLSPATKELLKRKFLPELELKDIPPLPTRTVLFEGSVDVDTGIGNPQLLAPGNTADVSADRGLKIQKTKGSDVDSHKKQSFKPSENDGNDDDSKPNKKEPDTSIEKSKDSEKDREQKAEDKATESEFDDFESHSEPVQTPEKQTPPVIPVTNVPKIDDIPTNNAIQNLGKTTGVNIKAGFVKP